VSLATAEGIKTLHEKLADHNEIVFERALSIPNFWHALVFKAVATSVDVEALDGAVRLQCSHCERAGASERSRTFWRGKYAELGHDEYVRRFCEQPTRNHARMIKNCIGCKIVAWGFDASLVGLARSTLTGHVQSTIDAGYIRPVAVEGRARKGERYRNPGEFQSRIYEVNPDFFDGLLVPVTRTCSACGTDISNRRPMPPPAEPAAARTLAAGPLSHLSVLALRMALRMAPSRH
jgi:hypothetical protein